MWRFDRITAQPASSTSTSRRVAVLTVLGVVLGVVTGLLPLVLGTVAFIPAALIVALAVVVRPRFLLFAAVSAGVGGVWSYGAISTAVRCGTEAGFCGDANLVPLGLASVVALTVAASAALVTLRRHQH